MADKVVSGIGRELRYFEYKLRKKQQASKKNKKDKNGNNLGQSPLTWSDAPTSDDFKFTPKNEDFQKAMPVNKGEEELQIQVALAMSREEEKERSRQSEGDKLRLEMAIKESAKEAEASNVTQQPQRSLLDLSAGAPKPTAATGANLFGSTATNDPWGGAAPTASAAQPSSTFDPFAPQQPAHPQPAPPLSNPFPPATSNFGSSDNAWGMSQTTPAAPVQSQDPWGASQPFAAPKQPVSQPNAFPPPQGKNDPWGNPIPAPQTATATQNGAWANPDPFLSSQHQSASFDPFTGTTTVPSSNPQNGFGTPMSSAAQSPPMSFGMPMSSAPVAQPPSSAFMMSSTSTFSAPPFDPLKDFDTLHINSEPNPVILQNDFGAGKSVAKDIFPLNQVLEPEPILATRTNGETLSAIPTKKETDVFLGANSNLVNLDSGGWKTYQVPYCAKPLGTVSHNPFQQSGPAKTLNEMKSTHQTNLF